MKFAAIDIGSNAVRLLMMRVLETDFGPFFKKESLVRMPIRLGTDAFARQRISEDNLSDLLYTMQGFRSLMKAYRPLDYMACATSAMREIENGEEIVRRIKEECDIELSIIDGAMEAKIIYANHFEQRLDRNRAYLYIDVGGGSTELTLFAKGKITSSSSYNIGTVRLLQNLVPDHSWDDMKKWIKSQTASMEEVIGIGSGGNINKLFRMSRTKEGRPVSYDRLKEITNMLKSYSYDERITTLNLRPDRADVIVPASRIYLSAMKWGRIKKIFVPQIGLADGVIHLLYEKYMGRKAGVSAAALQP